MEAATTRAGQPVARGFSRQIIVNILLMVLARCGGAIALVITVPVILDRLGPEVYGVWESLLAIAGMAMVIQAVISGTVQWRVSLSYGARDPAETRRLVRISIGATLFLMAICIPSVWAFQESIVGGLQVPEGCQPQVRWLLPSLVGVMLLGGLNESLATVLIGYQRAGIAMLALSGGLVVSSLASIGALVLGAGLDALLLGSVAGFVATFVILYILACSLCGRLSLLPLPPSRRDVAVMGPFLGLLLLSNLTVLVRDHTDKVILAVLVSPTEVGYFGMAQRLSMIVMQICAVCFIPFMSAIAVLHVTRNRREMRALYVKAGTWMATLGGLAGFLVCTLREPLFILWLGKRYAEAWPFLGILVLGCSSAVILTGPGVALAKGIGRAGLETRYTLVGLTLNVLLKPVLIAVLGGVGAVLASSLSWCLGALFFLYFLHRTVDLPPVMAYRLIGIWLVSIVLSALGWWVSGSLSVAENRPQAALVLLTWLPLLSLGYLGILGYSGLIPYKKSLEVVLKSIHGIKTRIANGNSVASSANRYAITGNPVSSRIARSADTTD